MKTGWQKTLSFRWMLKKDQIGFGTTHKSEAPQQWLRTNLRSDLLCGHIFMAAGTQEGNVTGKKTSEEKINILTFIFVSLKPYKLRWIIQYCACLPFRLSTGYWILLNTLFALQSRKPPQLVLPIELIPTSPERETMTFPEAQHLVARDCDVTHGSTNQCTVEKLPAAAVFARSDSRDSFVFF